MLALRLLAAITAILVVGCSDALVGRARFARQRLARRHAGRAVRVFCGVGGGVPAASHCRMRSRRGWSCRPGSCSPPWRRGVFRRPIRARARAGRATAGARSGGISRAELTRQRWVGAGAARDRRSSSPFASHSQSSPRPAVGTTSPITSTAPQAGCRRAESYWSRRRCLDLLRVLSRGVVICSGRGRWCWGLGDALVPWVAIGVWAACLLRAYALARQLGQSR